jgi:predicted Zn-dependent protease
LHFVKEIELSFNTSQKALLGRTGAYNTVRSIVQLYPLRRKYTAIFLAIFLTAATVGTAMASFSLEDERKLGKEFYEKLVKENVLLQNDRVNAFVNLVGQRVLAHSEKVAFDFKFSVIRSSAINAFATPGGYVYLNEGLINLVENEGQLAGVIAHEIGHVNGRHISEIIDRSQKLSISALAAILAGAFLGGGGDVTAAVTSFSLAAATAFSLKYSREQEEAADRMGMSYLVSAGYDGKSMLDFLKIMRRYEYYSNTIPSYFLTHPGTDERIRYIDALLQTTYTQGGKREIVGHLKRIQTILLLDETATDANLRHFQESLKDDPDDVDALYGLAVTYEKLGMTRESLEAFGKALRIVPDDPDILRDMGIAFFKLGRLKEAAGPLRRAAELAENDGNTLLYLGRTYEAMGDLQNAIGVYKKLEKRGPDDPEIYYNLAMTYGKANEKGDSHYYFGIFFKKKGKPDSALFHFKAAMKLFPSDSARAREIAKEIQSLKH